MGRLSGILAVACVLLLTGCMNAYVRWPTTSRRIEGVYQSTCEMAGITLIAAFPQVLGYGGGGHGLVWENLYTVPLLGLPCLVDTALEAVVDTICLPFDLTR